MYTIIIERKKLLKQRREKALQNTKDRKLAKENFLTALKAGHKADRASNDTQSSANSNDELINGVNADTIIRVDNIDNIEIVAEYVTNATTNAENIDTDSTNADNIAMKYINTLHSIITIGSSYIFRNNYDTYLQFHIVYCRDVIQHKVQVTTSQLHMMLLV